MMEEGLGPIRPPKSPVIYVLGWHYRGRLFMPSYWTVRWRITLRGTIESSASADAGGGGLGWLLYDLLLGLEV